MILYDDEGNLVTNPDTLEALEEAEEIIAEWEKRHDIRSKRTEKFFANSQS